MCRSRSRGGDGGAAQREAERQARIAAATAAINNIFGAGSGAESDQARQARDRMYATVGGDTRNFFANQLEEDRAAARRDLDFYKARHGLVGSSQGIDLNTEFQRRYDRGLLDIANRADAASSGMRTSDERTRLNLINNIVAGMDQGTAMSSALTQLQNNAENARQQAMQGRIANVFADLLGGFTTARHNAGMQAALQQQQRDNLGNAFADTGKTYGGTITR